MINDKPTDSGSPIRVTIVQPALPKYRIPVFRDLAGRRDIDLTVVFGSIPDLQNVDAYEFKATPSARWEWKVAGMTAMFQWAEWSYCSPRRSDVVVLRWSPRSVLVWLALLRGWFNSVAVVLWGHGYSKQERRWWSWLRGWQASLASAIVFYDPHTRDDYVSRGWSARRLFVALNTIDLHEIDAAIQLWRDQAEQLTSFRLTHGLDQGPVVLFVSRLSPPNRVDLLIRATAELSAHFPGLKTVIIGDGAVEKKRLQLLAQGLGIGDNVVFEDGVYDESKLAPWFLSASVFCYPANVGLSLIHAFAYGLPVVTSDNMDIQNPEIVALEPGVNGDVYRHESVQSLVRRLRELISDDNRLKVMALAARQTVDRAFTIERMVNGLEHAILYAHHTKMAKA